MIKSVDAGGVFFGESDQSNLELQTDSYGLINRAPRPPDECQDLLGIRAATIDDVVAVTGGDLGRTFLGATKTRLIDQPSGSITGRVLEDRTTRFPARALRLSQRGYFAKA